MSNTAVERVEITAETAGLDRAAQKVEQIAAQMAAAGMKMPKAMRESMLELAKSAVTAAKSTAVVTKEADAAAKRLSSMQRQAEAMQRQYDVGFRNAAKMAAEEAKLTKLVDAGTISRERANELLGFVAQRYSQVSAATQEAARAAEQLAQSQMRAAQEAAAEASRHAARIDDLRASFDPAYDAARRMSDEINRLAELERAGVAIMGGYESALDKIALKYDASAQAAARASAAQKKFLDDARAEQATANARIAAEQGQEKWNLATGYRPAASGAARASASVFEAAAEEQARQMAVLSEQARRLRTEIDPLGAAYERMNSQVASYRDMADHQLITQDELVLATQRSRDAFDDTAKSLKPVNDNMRLADHQVANLRSQFIDMGVMLQGGMSPVTILSTQLPQVYEALGSGPGGVGGSLRSIGASIMGFARSIPVAGYAVGGLATAVGALWYLTSGPDARSAEESVKTFEDAISRLKGRWQEAATAAEDYYRSAKDESDSPTKAFLDVRAEAAKLAADIKANVNDLDTSEALSGRILRPFSGHVSDARREISKVYADLRKGEITAKAAADAMLQIRLDPNADDYARNFADEIRRALDPVIEIERRVQALNNTLSQMAAPKGTMGRREMPDEVFNDRFGPTPGLGGRFGQSDAYDTIRDGLISQQEEFRKAADEAKAYTKSVADQRRSIADNVAGLRLQIDNFGATEGAMEAARMQADLLAEAERNAAEAKQKVDPALIEFIRAQASEYGRLTDQLQSLNAAEEQRKRVAEFDADLQFRVDQLGRTDIEQRVAEQMRSIGLSYGSAADAGREATIRFVETMEDARSKTDELAEGFRDAFADIVDAISSGDSAMDALLGGFGQLGRQLATSGLDKLFDGLTGKNGSGAPLAGGIAINVGGASAVQRSDEVIRAPLAALNDNLAKSATSALAVARQFDGLNSKADTGALDSFLRASGTWGRLSASDTAWCASFANASIIKAGGQGTGSNLASSFMNWGSATNAPKVGDIVVLRPQASGRSGHVGFVAGFGDGTVKVFGGNQSRGVNTKSFRDDQVVGYRTGLGTEEMTKAVSDGTIDAQKRIAAGAVPNSGVRQSADPGIAGLGQSMSKLSGGVQALGAGIGIFANAYQSASPIGGAISGALGGFSAGASLGASFAAIGAAGGPIGMAAGAVIGLLGGIFGKGKQKKQAKKARRDQARQSWDQNLPALNDLRDQVMDIQRGALSEDFISIDERTKQFADLAKETKRGEDVAKVNEIKAAAEVYKERLKALFRDTLDIVTGDLAEGLGLDTEFTKARDGVDKLADQYRGFIGDVELAFQVPVEKRTGILAAFEASKTAIDAAAKDKRVLGVGENDRLARTVVPGITPDAIAKRTGTAATARDKALAEYDAAYADAIVRRDAAIREATEAAKKGLLAIVSGDTPEQTEIMKALDQARGAAAGLKSALLQLGMTADGAAVAIDGAMTKRLALLKKQFDEDIGARINDLDGKGYVNQIRDLVKARDDMLADAARIGGDAEQVARYFKLAAQDLVDGAELTGPAFAELIKLFPDLTDVVTAFGKVVSSDIVQDGLKGFMSDRLAEATTKRNDAESALLNVYRDQADHLGGFSDQVKDFLKTMRLGDTSPLSQRDQFLEAQKAFRDTQALAATGDRDAQEKLVSASQDYLDAARAYFASGEGFTSSFNEVETVLKSADVKATSQLELLKTQVGALVDIDDGVKSVAEAIKALTEAITLQKDLQGKVDDGRSFGATPERNRLIDAGLRQLGFSFTGSYGLGRGGFGVNEFDLWRKRLPHDQQRAVDEVIAQYSGINRQRGGLIPGYRDGGVIGNGIWNRDSVLARYASGGSVALAGGEMVVRAPSVTPRTYPVLDAINRTGSLPAANGGPSLSEVVRRLDKLTAVIAAGMQMTTDEIARGNRTAEDGVSVQRRVAARAA